LSPTERNIMADVQILLVGCSEGLLTMPDYHG